MAASFLSRFTDDSSFRDGVYEVRELAVAIIVSQVDEPGICEKGGGGLILPLLGDTEQEWPKGLRIVLYLLGLGWCFLGVAIVSDIFMAAIERVTSKKHRVKTKEGKYVTAMVWNATVANLTLMALGSSAPEILLSVIELLGNDFFSGDLGPSTIVGSAAFNLLCITAVCIMAIEDGQVRYIKEVPVYIITASFSVFAYIWLIVILQIITPNIVEVWEGTVTFLMFPVLVILAFAADKGWFSPEGYRNPQTAHGIVDEDMTMEELAALELKFRQQYGENITEEQVMKLIEAERAAPKTRAQYRVAAVKEMTGGKKKAASTDVDPLYNVVPTVGAGADPKAKHIELPTFDFLAVQYTVLENAGCLIIPVVRKGDTTSYSAVSFATRAGSASPLSDYIHVEGRLDFKPGEIKKEIEVKIIDDTDFEQDEDFYVDLMECEGFHSLIGHGKTARVVIIDDDEPGVLMYKDEMFTATESAEDQTIEIVVQRRMGGSGVIGCSWHTEDDSAIAGSDYEAASGTLSFQAGQMEGSVFVKVNAVGRYERTEMFRVILDKPTGGCKFDERTDGGKETCIASIYIESDKAHKERVDRLMSGLKVNWDKARVGHNNWKDQFMEAFFVNGGGEDEDGEEKEPPTAMDYALHVVTMPWKVLFAFVPPPDFCDGWVCFVCALIAIGGVTAIIGDMAGLLGCCMNVPNEITAITFVALGTSLPDTFASKAAATQDAHADASIGNVVGSNSVNVFLGLGLPWMIGAMKWTSGGGNEKWNTMYLDKPWIGGWEAGAFVVEAGGLAFSVSVFTLCALICLALLYIRRIMCGGELGGPQQLKIASAVLLVGLWFFYIGMSSWYILGKK